MLIATLFSLFTFQASSFVPYHRRQNLVALQAEGSEASAVDDELWIQKLQAASDLQGETILVKYGGNAMTSETLKEFFCQDVALLQRLGVRVMVVHGGGPQISDLLKRLDVETRFESGMRVSSEEVVSVAEMALGSVNKQIASIICRNKGQAVGLSGRDNNILECTKLLRTDDLDLGNVGTVVRVNTDFLKSLLDQSVCPVLAPIGGSVQAGDSDIVWNVNADVVAGQVAAAIQADRVVFLTDIAGVLDKSMELIPSLTIQDVDELIKDVTITGGMIPKISYATEAVQAGVASAYITDGRVPHALLKQVLGEASGTAVTLN